MAPKRRVNQAQLARMAGVSRTTVSRALADHPAVSAPVVARIKMLARRLNYRPNAAARSVVNQRNSMIGMVVCNAELTRTVYSTLLSSVELAACKAGLKTQVSQCDLSKSERTQLPPIFQDDGVDGVVMAGDVPDWLLEQLSHWRMPFVLLGTHMGPANVNQVGSDPREGGRLAAEHLLSLGHRKIGLIMGPRRRVMHREYFEGFEGVCLAAGIGKQQIEAGVIESSTTDMIRYMRTLRQRMPDATAVFASTSSVAWQIVQFFRAVDRRVPQEISVLGVGDTLGEFRTDLQVTIVDERLGEMAHAAVALLRDVIDNHDIPSRRIVVDPVVVPGDTTAPLNGQAI